MIGNILLFLDRFFILFGLLNFVFFFTFSLNMLCIYMYVIEVTMATPCRKGEGQAKLFDESEEKARLQERQKLFKDYRNKRQAVVQIRNADREQRNEAKVKQLEQAEEWQVHVHIIPVYNTLYTL